MEIDIRKLILLILVFACVNLQAIAESTAEYEVGKTIFFGSYMTKRNGEKAPIGWVILENKKGQLTCISEKVLDYREFHEKEGGALWTHSLLRKWLNHDFFNMVFDKNEQKAIVSTRRDNGMAGYFDSLGGSNDKVTILSVQECIRYFSEKERYQWYNDFKMTYPKSDYEYIDITKSFRVTEMTEYAKMRETELFKKQGLSNLIGKKMIAEWWTRTNCYDKEMALTMCTAKKDFYFSMYHTRLRSFGVRPVIVLDIRKYTELQN